MEQAYGFTPTHTEHNIISYSAYQIGENVDREKKNQKPQNSSSVEHKEQMQCFYKELLLSQATEILE